MNFVTLKQVATVNPPGDALPSDRNVAFVGMAELDAESAVARPRELRPFREVANGYTQFRDKDILAAKITPCWENGKVGQADLDGLVGVGSTEFHVVRPGPELNERYLLHFLRQPWIRRLGTVRMTGSGGQRRVPAHLLRGLTVPFPDFAEQQRISRLLDDAALVAVKRRGVSERLRDLVPSLFSEMIRPYTPGQWTEVRLGDLLDNVETGRSPICETREAEPDEWGVLKLGAVTYGSFRPDQNKAYLGDIDTMRRYEVRPGDVLMTRKNTRELVGAVALVGEVRPRLLLPDLVFRLSLSRERLDPSFFQTLMMHPSKRPTVRRLSSGSAGSMPNIPMSRLKELRIEIPPISLQREFADRANQVRVLEKDAEESSRAVRELFDTLRDRAFRGEL